MPPSPADNNSPDDPSVFEQLLEEVKGLRGDVASVKVSRWLNLTAALACIACLVAAVVAWSFANTAVDNANDTEQRLGVAKDQLALQIREAKATSQLNTQIGCSLGEIVINAQRVPRDDENLAEFVGRLQTYARLLRQLRLANCQVAPGTVPFEQRRRQSLDEVEQILGDLGAPLGPAARPTPTDPRQPGGNTRPANPGPTDQPDPTNPGRPDQPDPPSPGPDVEPTDPDPPATPTPPATPSRPGVGDAVKGVGEAVDEILAPVCSTAPLPIACPR